MLHALFILALSCRDGDVPAPLGDMAPDEAELALDVDERGVGRVRARLKLTHAGDGPAVGTVSLATEGAPSPVVRAARQRGGAWLTLDDAERARGAFDDFTAALEHGVEPHLARDGRVRSAILVSLAEDGSDAAELAVAAACSAREVEVELIFVVDGAPADGGLRYVVPVLAPRARLTVVSDAREVFIDGQRRATASRDALAVLARDEEAGAHFIVHVERRDVITARVARRVVPAGPRRDEDDHAARDTTLVHVALDAPSAFRAPPRDLRVVFVVDASVSVGEEGVRRALALVREVIDRLPDDAGYAVVAATRRPSLLVPPWRDVTSTDFPAPAVANGSDIDRALAKAARIARDAPPGAGRVVVVSDLELASGGDVRLADAVARVAGEGAPAPLVHVVALPDGLMADTRGLDFERPRHGAVTDADDALMAAVEATGGVLLVASAGDDGDGALARHLVMPTSLDFVELRLDGVPVAARDDVRDIAVRASGQDGNDDVLPEVIRAGEGVRAELVVDDAVARVDLSGFLWGTPVALPLAASSRASTLGLGQLANDVLADALSDDEVRAVARAERFVSKETAFVDVPTWRPSATAMGGASGSCCGCGGIGLRGVGTSSCCIGCGAARASSAQDTLDALAREVAGLCGVEAVTARVEISSHEILAVVVERGGRCAEEGIWRARLDRGVRDALLETQRTWDISSLRGAPHEPSADIDAR